MNPLTIHSQQSVVDPVCGMALESESSKGGLYNFKGATYYFCSPNCRTKFQADPESYLNVAKEDQRADADDAIYTCPMHPEVRQKGPGACPICGMALEPLVQAFSEEPNPELADMSRRFWVSLVLAAPIFLVSMIEMLPGHPLHHFLSGRPWILTQLALASPVVLWGAWPFFKRGWTSVVTRRLNMFTLIALGAGMAYLYSLVAALAPQLFPSTLRNDQGTVGVYFEAAAVITVLVLLGQVFELRARQGTGEAIKALLKLAPKTARRIEKDGSEVDVPLEQVHPGDRLRVRPGESIPTDGGVVEGASAVDESMITGESIPAEKGPGAKVTAGTINGNGSLVIQAERVGNDTLLAQIVRTVSQAQRSRAPIQRLADRVSAYFVPAVMGVATLTFFVWWLMMPEQRVAHALVHSVAVLIIACPCALGLATPMSIMVGVGRGAQAGVLVKDAQALETLEKVDTLILDKTGTLTEGKPRLLTIEKCGALQTSEILTLAASLERASEHPLAAAVVAKARSEGLSLVEPVDFKAVPGRGLEGIVQGRKIVIGNQGWLMEKGIPTDSVADRAKVLGQQGQTVLWVGIDGVLIGLLGVADSIKPSTPEALRSLREQGLHLVMVTGDNPLTAQAVAKQLGIDEVHAEVLPNRKGEVVQALQQKGHVVAMAGDGVNDAPALALADIGIAMGTGTDIAMESADITLVKGDLRAIARARNLSRATMKNIRQNLFFAFLYNTLGVPIAAGVLYPWFGILLSPMLASAAMSLSSVSVIGNALRLRRQIL